MWTLIAPLTLGLNILGPALPPSENLPQVCRVWFRNVGSPPFQDGEPLSFCTGTLITSQHLLTSAHCVQTHSSLRFVECPDLKTLETDKKISIRSAQIENLLEETYWTHNRNAPLSQDFLITHDLSVIRLPQPIENLNPLNFVKNQKQLRWFMKHYLRENFRGCRLAGFGKNSNLGPRPGRQLEHRVLTTIEINPTSYKTWGFYPIMTGAYLRAQVSGTIRFTDRTSAAVMTQDSAQSVSLVKDDSGGPLYCKDQNQNWTLVGVASGTTSVDEGLTYKITHNFWTLLGSNSASKFLEEVLR